MILPERKDDKEDKGKRAEEKVGLEEADGEESPEKYVDECRRNGKDGAKK